MKARGPQHAPLVHTTKAGTDLYGCTTRKHCNCESAMCHALIGSPDLGRYRRQLTAVPSLRVCCVKSPPTPTSPLSLSGTKPIKEKCAHTHTHTYTHTHTLHHAHARAHTHTHTHTHAHTHTHTRTHARTHTHTTPCTPVSYTHLTLPTNHRV